MGTYFTKMVHIFTKMGTYVFHKKWGYTSPPKLKQKPDLTAHKTCHAVCSGRKTIQLCTTTFATTQLPISYHFLPSVDQAVAVVLDGQDPLPAVLVGRVLPQRLDALLEEVEVGIVVHLVWQDDVVVQLPKLHNLQGRESVQIMTCT